MDIVLTGSVAYDYLMTFPGLFKEHIIPDKLEHISLSFLVDGMVKRRGGIAPNIAYTLALLGGKPRVMATVGEDFAEYRALRLGCLLGQNEWEHLHAFGQFELRHYPRILAVKEFFGLVFIGPRR